MTPYGIVGYRYAPHAGTVYRRLTILRDLQPKVYHVPELEEPYFIQVSVSDELGRALKAHAAQSGMFLTDVFLEALDQFIAHRQLSQKRGQFIPYLSHPKGSGPLNMRLPKKLGLRIESLAETDKVPVRRFAYTALIHYAINLKLIAPATTVQSGPPATHQEPNVTQMLREFRKKTNQRKP